MEKRADLQIYSEAVTVSDHNITNWDCEKAEQFAEKLDVIASHQEREAACVRAQVDALQVMNRAIRAIKEEVEK